jgi:flagellar biogenesis protein FliO
MFLTSRGAKPRPMARRSAPDGTAGKPVGRTISRRVGLIALGAVVAGIAAVGIFAPSAALGGSPSSGSAGNPASGSSVGSPLGTGGIDVMDLVIKGGLVLVLLFITLRVLGRMQGASTRRGSHIDVIESRNLASKASLHLVAVGDRRLIIGLTPAGMVSLAEIGAYELEEAEAARAAAEAAAAQAAAAAVAARASNGRIPSGLAGQPLSPVLASLVAPIDSVTDRLAGFFNGARTR